MALSRNQTHLVIMTVIYNELVDYSFSDGSNFSRSAQEMICETVEHP